MGESRITSIRNDKSNRPINLNFQSGQLLNGNKNRFDCGVFETEDGRIETVLATDRLLFSGEVKDASHNYFLAIRNKKNEIRLIAVDNAELTVKTPKKRKLNDEDTLDTGISQLNKQFGSKKAKRYTEQSERLKINVDTIKKQLEKTVADVTINEKDLAPETAPTASYLPPVDTAAGFVEEVYKLNELVSDVVLDSLKDQAKGHLQSKEGVEFRSEYSKSEFSKLKTTTHPDKLKHIEILLLVDSIIGMVCENAKVISLRRYDPCPHSKLVSSYLLENFTIQSDKGRARPTSMRDKSICYILVLSMFINEYVVNLEDIGKAVKQGVKKLQEISRVLLFTLHSKNKNIAILKMPLPPVLTGKGSPKKGRKK